MIVYLNNKQFEFAQTKSLAEVITSDLNLQHNKGLAVTVNQEVVPKSAWDAFLLKENDKVTIIKATQGG